MGGRHAVFASFVLSLAFLSSLFSIVRVAPDVSAMELPILSLTAAPGLAYAPRVRAEFNKRVLHEGQAVTFRCWIERDETNRTLTLAIGKGVGYGTSSARQLDDKSSRLHELAIPNGRLGCGAYVGRCTLTRVVEVVVDGDRRERKLVQHVADTDLNVKGSACDGAASVLE